MRSWLVMVAALVVACSPPPSRPPTPPPQVLPDASPDAPTDAPVTVIPRAPEVYTFPWQSIRDWFEDVVAGKTPCDYTKALERGTVGTGDCAPPVQLAAKVISMKVYIKDGYLAEVTLDLGFPEGVTKDWYGALLDERGRIVGGWVHPDYIDADRTFLTVPVKDASAKRFKRAALVKELP
ncbi:MAG: hypothetical protein KIT31_18670 [Deltaproteobacteria bacterium]|nr:hypothetical protein [Deltaproteobacteria bacterium]